MSNPFIKEKALPNILVYFLKFNLPKEQENTFLKHVRKAVNQIYGPDQYVVYRVNDNELQYSSRILSAKALLIVAKQDSLDDLKFKSSASELKRVFLNYEKLFPSCDFNFDYFRENIKTLIPQEHVTIDSLLSDQKNDLFFFDSLNLHLKWPLFNSSLKLVDYSPETKLDSDSVFLIDCNNGKLSNPVPILFDVKNYFENLATNLFGRSLIFTNVTPTTMSMANQVKMIHGIVATANYQTSGLGRNENQWLSPFGCAPFTINLRFPFDNALMGRVTLIQHIASLSIVLALPKDKLNIKIKWPNDILYAESMSKLAGILVRSYSYENHINVQIGIGINVSNKRPSICLDELICHYNSNQTNDSEKIRLMTKEEVIAKTLNHFENLYNKLMNNELSEIKQLYCDNWIHSESLVDVQENGEGLVKARIIGIDDNGYLLAKSVSNESLFFLQPDGNRFDMMNCLIAHNPIRV